MRSKKGDQSQEPCEQQNLKTIIFGWSGESMSSDKSSWSQEVFA